MKPYLIVIGILSIFYKLIDTGSAMEQSASDEKLQRVMQVMAEYPQLAEEMFKKANKIKEENPIYKDCGQVFMYHPELIDDMLAYVNSVSYTEPTSYGGSVTVSALALRNIPIEYQQTLTGVDIFNGERFQGNQVVRIDFNGIPLDVDCSVQLSSLIQERKKLYNLRTLELSRFAGVDLFIETFFSTQNTQLLRPISFCFLSLFGIHIADRGGSVINEHSLKSILDHFTSYSELVRDMVQRNFKNDEVAVFLNIHGVSDQLLSRFNELGHEYAKVAGDARLLVIRDNVNVRYRTGEVKENINFIAILNAR